MKKSIHPKYHNNTTVTCACGHTFITGSTLPSLHVEICSKCHPFYTGEQKFVDIEGRVDKFKKKQSIADKARQKRIKRVKKKIQKEDLRKNAPKSLKEMLKSL